MAKKTKPATAVPPGAGDALSFDTDELLSAVTERIAATGCPDPSLMVEDLDPLASLWLAHELVQEVLALWTSSLQKFLPEEADEREQLSHPMAFLTIAFDALTRACVGAGILPEKVLEGMEQL